MPKTFGHSSRFSIEITGPCDSSNDLCIVDVWAADRWLTCDDNHAYLPQFIGDLMHCTKFMLDQSRQSTRARPYPELSIAENHLALRAEAKTDNRRYLAYQFMDWGPTADNVSMHYFREGDTVYLPFSFWRESHHKPSELGQVFVAELNYWELAEILNDAAWDLMWKWHNRKHYPPSDLSNSGS